MAWNVPGEWVPHIHRKQFLYICGRDQPMNQNLRGRVLFDQRGPESQVRGST